MIRVVIVALTALVTPDLWYLVAAGLCWFWTATIRHAGGEPDPDIGSRGLRDQRAGQSFMPFAEIEEHGRIPSNPIDRLTEALRVLAGEEVGNFAGNTDVYRGQCPPALSDPRSGQRGNDQGRRIRQIAARRP